MANQRTIHTHVWKFPCFAPVGVDATPLKGYDGDGVFVPIASSEQEALRIYGTAQRPVPATTKTIRLDDATAVAAFLRRSNASRVILDPESAPLTGTTAEFLESLERSG